MTTESFKGYRGPARAFLENARVRVWSDVVIITKQGGSFAGLILPRSENTDDTHIVLKLHNGYNTGLHVDNIQSVEEKGYQQATKKSIAARFPYDPDKKSVTILGTGGTIASRFDELTGAMIPAFTPDELYATVPEIADICNLRTENLFGIFSENMAPSRYIEMAEAIGRVIRDGTDGIVITHGTDTMQYSAAALSFMVQNSPVPIVMVGSQRPSDLPSSDAPFNLLCASHVAAHSDIAETTVCMFGPTSEQYNLLHRGTRVRKMHSSRRDAFRTIDDRPLAMVTPTTITLLQNDFAKRRHDRQVVIDAVFEDKTTLLYFYPHMQPDIIDGLIDHDYKGIIIAGAGLGHINEGMLGAIKKARTHGIAIYMTAQTLWGHTQMSVYETGRDLLEVGVQPLNNMLPEVAYIKLGWALGHKNISESELNTMMLKPIAGETLLREPYDGYMIMQGGVPIDLTII